MLSNRPKTSNKVILLIKSLSLFILFSCGEDNGSDITEAEEQEKLSIDALADDSLFTVLVKKIYLDYSEEIDPALAVELIGGSYDDEEGPEIYPDEYDLDTMSLEDQDLLAQAIGFPDIKILKEHVDEINILRVELAAKYETNAVTWADLSPYVRSVYNEIVDDTGQNRPFSTFGRPTEDEPGSTDSLTFNDCFASTDINAYCTAIYQDCWLEADNFYLPKLPPFSEECPEFNKELFGVPFSCTYQDYIDYRFTLNRCLSDWKCCIVTECNDDNGVLSDLINENCYFGS